MPNMTIRITVNQRKRWHLAAAVAETSVSHIARLLLQTWADGVLDGTTFEEHAPPNDDVQPQGGQLRH